MAPPSAAYTVPDMLQDLAAAWSGSAPACRTQHAALHRTHLRSARGAFCHCNISRKTKLRGPFCFLVERIVLGAPPGFEVGFPPVPTVTLCTLFPQAKLQDTRRAPATLESAQQQAQQPVSC